jgi:UDP-2,3-diacylglucosamine hydrolase
VVKVCKPIQDTRFDMPAVGRATIDTMRSADARVLVVEADRAVVFDREAMIESADAYGITILALSEPHFSANSE